MFTELPRTSEEFAVLRWTQIEPWYRELLTGPLSQETLQAWMKQWSDLSALVDEAMIRLEIVCTQNVADEELVERKQHFREEIYMPVQTLDQQVKERLLVSGLEPEGFALPLRNLRAEAALYREENLALLNEDRALSDSYYQINGTQMVSWEGQDIPVTALYSVMDDPDRMRREQAWRALTERKFVDKEKLDAIWIQKMRLRQQIAHNAGYSDYRAYRWQQLLRFDYTPADCKTFHEAVEQVIVPTASQLWEKRRQQLGVERLRPWDMQVSPQVQAAPRTITDVPGVLQQCAAVFHLVDPQLGSYFDTMIEENLLDLDERPNKADDGYSLPLEVRRRPFTFGHLVSIPDVVQLVFHEAGHGFHVFETIPLPYIHQRKESAVPMEFAEVASTSMEYIGAIYLAQAKICSEQEEAQLRIQHLENTLTNYLPRIIMGDAFQHWVYDNPEQAMEPEQCQQKWAELSRRFQPDIDWSGLEAERGDGWQGVNHFFVDPLYFIEYAFAAIGAIQIWDNYLQDPQKAIRQYRHALSLGATKTVPELYAAAGAKFAFDAEILQLVQQLIMHTVAELEG